MVKRSKLVQFCNDLLQIHEVNDYCPNGLQVEGRKQIKKIVTGVTASLSLIEQAIAQQADAILVHHGFFWKNEPAELTGLKYQRVRLLIEHKINLLAYHLPLDMHVELGNNIQMAHQLGIQNPRCIQGGKAKGLFWFGRFEAEKTIAELEQLIDERFKRKPLVIAGHNKAIKKIAWCSGAAQDLMRYAIDRGMDAFISGEVSEHSYYTAMESGMVYFAAGHHATERYGVQALGERLKNEFDLSHVFIDIPNPV